MTLRQCQAIFQKNLKKGISKRFNLPVGFSLRFHPLYDKIILYAGMVELADTLDLGSNGIAVQVQVLLPAPRRRELRMVRGGIFSLSFLCCASTPQWYRRFS